MRTSHASDHSLSICDTSPFGPPCEIFRCSLVAVLQVSVVVVNERLQFACEFSLRIRSATMAMPVPIAHCGRRDNLDVQERVVIKRHVYLSHHCGIRMEDNQSANL